MKLVVSNYGNTDTTIIDGYSLTPSRSVREVIFEMCKMLDRQGYSQTECSDIMTIWFKKQFPHYDFTYPKNNSDVERKTYSNIRKAISDYFKQKTTDTIAIHITMKKHDYSFIENASKRKGMALNEYIISTMLSVSTK